MFLTGKFQNQKTIPPLREPKEKLPGVINTSQSGLKP
jgi:hypothetical protein